MDISVVIPLFNEEECDHILRQVSTAYITLSDPVARNHYDRQWLQHNKAQNSAHIVNRSFQQTGLKKNPKVTETPKKAFKSPPSSHEAGGLRKPEVKKQANVVHIAEARARTAENKKAPNFYADAKKVSIASATPRPRLHRWRRYAMVASQSIVASHQGSTVLCGSATTCAAENATRDVGRPVPAAKARGKPRL